MADDSTAPLVSIGLPIYNGERFLRGTLDMLARQTFADYELVIVDNGSTDGTAAICRERAARDRRIRYVRYDQTVPVAENFGRTLAHARGTYFLWNPADDRRAPDAIEQAVATFARHPDSVMVHGPVELDVVAEQRIVTVPNRMDLTSTKAADRVGALSRDLRHNAMLYGVYKREALARVSLHQHLGHDYLVCLQMALIGPIAYVPSPLIRYHHVWGPIDHPMYEFELSLKGLLADQSSRRHKCWVVLVRGAHYLMTLPGASRSDRVTSTLAHLRVFTARHWRHLLAELAFIATTPLAWVLRPLIMARHRRRRARATAGAAMPS